MNLLRGFFFLLLILAANRFFYIGSWWHQHGMFDVADLGNITICLTLFLLFIFSKKRSRLWNPVSFLILFHLLFVFLQFLMVQINYNQPLLDSVIAVRHNLYFLSFFVFLLLLDNKEDISSLLNLYTTLALFILILGVINYYHPVIFYHKWAEGHGIRLEIKRAFFPGMTLMTFAALWTYANWYNQIERRAAGAKFGLLCIVHILRQTRMRLFGLVIGILTILALERKWKQNLILLFTVIISIIAIELFMEKNIITAQFTQAISNVIEKQGTWSSRNQQIKFDIKEFKKHPWCGDGLVAVREHGRHWSQIKLQRITFNADLGYTSWLKYYGIIGILWLFIFFSTQFFLSLRALSCGAENEKNIVMFSLSYLTNLIFIFFTLYELRSPPGIFLICLNAAIIVRMYQLNCQVAKPKEIVSC